jgi:hypothetical protein
VERDAAVRGEIADARCRQADDIEEVGRGADDLDVRTADGGGEVGGARSAHSHGVARPRADELVQRSVGEHLTTAHHDHVIGGLRHLAHEVAGEQHGASLRGGVPHELTHPAHALGVEPVDRLVEDQRVRIAEQR